ncbi:anti-anti-sigma regulatory factor [Magnetococcus marinus MC-1]|uniref:Anti-anti-sigma regulatory factor n=1 Tax=Magnetococcus marinus (strain ATCC BAA-1437 / JCM 17883 / MC-1) TaxID=156889 RepID=A0L670_MAGMM|nr:STAS domain-containing protein [Magnetococcus marinus]ABK43463.1 anti-anti-sigma regulatory factor [Magnetococcus marinus MC-1]
MTFSDSGEIVVTQNDSETVIRVRGRFNVQQLFEVNNIRPSDQPNHSYIIDLTETEFLDSSGMGIILRLREQVSGTKENMVIRNARPGIRRLLETVQFDKLFTVL